MIVENKVEILVEIAYLFWGPLSPKNIFYKKMYVCMQLWREKYLITKFATNISTGIKKMHKKGFLKINPLLGQKTSKKSVFTFYKKSHFIMVLIKLGSEITLRVPQHGLNHISLKNSSLIFISINMFKILFYFPT